MLDFTPALDRPLVGDEIQHVDNNGGAGRLYQMIVSDLLPYVLNRFRCSDHLALFGHSFGGLFALHALGQPTTPWSSFIISAPSVWWGDGAVLDYSPPLQSSTVFLSVGEFDDDTMREGADRTWEALSSRESVDIYGQVVAGEPHQTSDFSALSHGMRVLFDGQHQRTLRRRFRQLDKESLAIP